MPKEDWSTGIPWPETLAREYVPKAWPPYAFGTANAAILVLLHRPNLGEHDGLKFVPPHTPNLGGVPNANVVWEVAKGTQGKRSYDLLRKWIEIACQPFKIKNPLAALMVANLNPGPGKTKDPIANRRALSPGGRVDVICRKIRPLVVLACGGPVKEAIARTTWRPPAGKLVEVDHPSTWEGYGSGRRDGPDVIVPLFRKWARTGEIA